MSYTWGGVDSADQSRDNSCRWRADGYKGSASLGLLRCTKVNDIVPFFVLDRGGLVDGVEEVEGVEELGVGELGVGS